MLKTDVVPNLQLIKVRGHFAWPALIFKSWVSLSSHLKDFVLFSFLIEQWAPFCKGFCMPWIPVMSWQAQMSSYAWVFFSRSMVDTSLRSEQKVNESKTKKFNLKSATHLYTWWENPYIFPFFSFSPLHVEKYYTYVNIVLILKINNEGKAYLNQSKDSVSQTRFKWKGNQTSLFLALLERYLLFHPRRSPC